jgi:alkaline phosphatase
MLSVQTGYASISGGDGMGSTDKTTNFSYYNKLNKAGNTIGGISSFLALPRNAEADLSALATVGYVDQTLFFYANADSAAAGMKMATIRTYADGHTELNPNAVPVPASVLLLGSGLLGLIGIRRKMSN